MSPAFSTATSWSSVQSRITTPRSVSRSRTAWNEEVNFNSNRYRLLDASQKQRETEEVDRIISDLEAQRRYRSPRNRTKCSSNKQEVTVVPIRSDTPLRDNISTRLGKSSRHSNDHFSLEDTCDEGDESLPVNQHHAIDDVSQSFQDQVLEELRKLKNAQRIEFEALERLQREKDEAERKARRLEQKLREQERHLSRKADSIVRNSDSTRKVKARPDILHREEVDNEHSRKNHVRNNSDTGDASDKDEFEEDEPEIVDWNDVTESPPPYFTGASPATSPFKRSSGWPAWTGDESLPQGPSSEPQECSSPEPLKFLRQSSRSESKSDMFSTSRSRPDSAVSSHVSRLSQSRSRSPSARWTSRSSQDSQELRRSCAFFEDKARAHAEAKEYEQEKAKRLERACNAAPPQKLLEREALAQKRKSQQRKELEREWRAEYLAKRAKARDVPIATYLSMSEAGEAEQKRIQRIRQRAQEMMQSAELPLRMAMASKNGFDATPNSENGEEVERMTVKMKKRLKGAAEDEARRRRPQPKDVPNFDQLHSKWEATKKKRKELARRSHESTEFFTSRTAKLAELQEKKEARKQRRQIKEEAIRQRAQLAKEKLLARTRASQVKGTVVQAKTTKAETLRVQRLMAESTKQQKERQREEREADARERRREETARRVRAQVKRSENVRRENYAGNFMDLKDLDDVAKEKAREQRQQFKEAIARNKEKLLAAAATRPSLMERFTTDVKRETHRRAALEAVVKTVFENDLSTLKGVLTDDEQELAREMVAVDNSDKNSET